MVWPYVQCNIRYRSNLSLSHLRPLHLTSGKRWWSKLQPMICMHVYIYICTVILPSDSSIVCHLKATMCKVRSIYKYPMFHSYVQWHQYKDANISTQSLHKTPETWPLSLPSRTCCGFPSKSAKAPLSRPPSWRWRFGQHQVTQSFGQHHYIYIYHHYYHYYHYYYYYYMGLSLQLQIMVRNSEPETDEGDTSWRTQNNSWHPSLGQL